MNSSSVARRGLSFVWRVYPARLLGLLLCMPVVWGGIASFHPPAWLWALMFINGVLWAHLALWLALQSPEPFKSEKGHILFDSAFGSFWIVMMGFNPLASVLIWMMLWMNNMAAGGLPMFGRGLVFCLLGLAVGLAVVTQFPQWQINLEVGAGMMCAALPGLLLYPLAMGVIAYRLAKQLSDQKKQLLDLNRKDGLTGLYNRSYWDERAQAQLSQALRNGQPLSLIMLDVDYFKAINDNFGHERGDLVLRHIATCLQQAVREHELLARYGGEEFVVALQGATVDEAQIAAERLRMAVAERPFVAAQPLAEPLFCTISLGVAQWQLGMGFTEWVRAADKALYMAKRRGRNCTCAYEAGVSPLPTPSAAAGQNHRE